MNENSKNEFTIQEGFVVLDKNSELVEWLIRMKKQKIMSKF